MSYTPGEVASRAGVEAAFVDRLCDLGLLVPSRDGLSEGDVRRARILQALVEAGLGLEAIAEGTRLVAVDLSFVDDAACGDEVVAAAPGLAAVGIRFDPIGPVELKGLTEAVSLQVARRGRDAATR